MIDQAVLYWINQTNLFFPIYGQKRKMIIMCT